MRKVIFFNSKKRIRTTLNKANIKAENIKSDLYTSIEFLAYRPNCFNAALYSAKLIAKFRKDNPSPPTPIIIPRLLYIEFIFLQEDTSDTLNKPFRSDSPPLGPFFMERLVQKSLRYYIPRFADYKFRNRLWLCLISQSFKLRKHTLAPVVSCHAGKISKHSEQMCAKYRTRSLFNFKNNCDEWLQQEKRLKNYQFPKNSERENAVTYGNGP